MRNFAKVFGQTKPVIGMVHLGALPGSPLYDEKAGIAGLLAGARADLKALQAAGFDAVMFGNENDRPYEFAVDTASTATMAAVIGALRSKITVPFGVNVLWDPMATVALAAATGAHFVREIFTGTYASDMGPWTPNAGAAMRYRNRLGRADLAMDVLGAVTCPTLLIVGGFDFDVLRLNRQVAARLRAPHALLVVPGASHLFEEPGTLHHAATLARDWFLQHLSPAMD